MSRLRKCPYCGGVVGEGFPYMHYHEGMDKWVLSHSCGFNKNFEFGVSVWVTGKTEQEVIDFWNGVKDEVQESESL